MCNLAKERNVLKIIEEPLRVVEAEHGLWGLDCVAQWVESRRRAIIAESMDERDQAVDKSSETPD